MFCSKCDVKDRFYTILVPQCYKTFHILLEKATKAAAKLKDRNAKYLSGN